MAQTTNACVPKELQIDTPWLALWKSQAVQTHLTEFYEGITGATRSAETQRLRVEMLRIAMKYQSGSKILLFAIAAVWVVALVAGFRTLFAYEIKPGKASRESAAWPPGTPFSFSKRTPTLVMIAHPLCSCTRASLAELEKLMASVDSRLTAYVIVGDSQLAGPPETTPIFHRAAAISGVRAIADRNGTYSRLFGAATSGQIYLYDKEGRLRFAGGITQARGHEGPSRGRAQIISFLNDGSLEHPSSRVFGCPLKTSTGEAR